MSRNMFIEAIKTEQRRIQRFINLSKPGSAERGSLYIKKQGGRLYAYERLQDKGGHMRKVYLGSLDSEAVQELFADKFREKRLTHLRHDQKLLEKLENLDVDSMSPRDALDCLYELKKLIDEIDD